MVMSPFANTEVNITFPNGTWISKTLEWLDVYQEMSPSTDLTGTIVQSSKPVSVVSGASCSYVIQKNDCDMISEQLIPTNAFQRMFIVPPILSNRFVVRIFSSQINSTVCVRDVAVGNCTMMGSNQWIESAPKHSSLVVTSHDPISVIQYKESDTYMTIVPSIQQFINSYTFVVPEVYINHDNYISVTILTAASQTLRLDGKPPRDHLVDTANVASPFNNYTVLTFRITTGLHVMTTTETDVLFGLIAFGNFTFGAYGFPAGIDLGNSNGKVCLQCQHLTDNFSATAVMKFLT
ncbi:IgGFc-binding protein-like [Dreissena polymorpha]|uniref:IgGFc-binding protein-like n=1 Tax=Dreissena polymorpha TaxID=45954 RepID=UPI0022646AC0|nr:IgGFc-binding protein-like [Dreissena polymorpha]